MDIVYFMIGLLKTNSDSLIYMKIKLSIDFCLLLCKGIYFFVPEITPNAVGIFRFDKQDKKASGIYRIKQFFWQKCLYEWDFVFADLHQFIDVMYADF